MADLYPARQSNFAADLRAHRATTQQTADEPARAPNGRTLKATYDYREEQGELLYQVCRFEPKDFRQRRPKDGGGWEWKLGDVRRVLYRLPELKTASRDVPVFIVEGEKDADRLIELDSDIIATTNVGGAGKWRTEYSEFLRGRYVVILPDNDDAGRKHARQAAAALNGIAKSVRIVELPGLPPKGDVSDYFDAGGTLDAMLDYVEAAKSWTSDDMAAAADAPSLDVIEVADVNPLPVEWLWENRVPLGMLTLCDGNPGVGKSTLWIDIIARLSRGHRMPPGPASKIGGTKSRHSLILSAEDDPARIIRPRLEAAGADLNLVSVLTTLKDGGDRRPVALPYDLPYIQRFIEERQTGLVIIDPIMAFIGDGIDTHTDQNVRRCLFPIAQMAEATGAAVVAIRHLNKKTGGDAIYRGGGSIAFTAAARVGLIVGTDPDAADTMVLAVAKTNVGPRPESITYTIQPFEGKQGTTSRVSWGGLCDLGANDIIDHQVQRHTKQDDAGDLIEHALAERPLAAAELESPVVGPLVSKRTFERSRRNLQTAGRVVRGKSGMEGGWHYRLPAQRFTWEQGADDGSGKKNANSA